MPRSYSYVRRTRLALPVMALLIASVAHASPSRSSLPPTLLTSDGVWSEPFASRPTRASAVAAYDSARDQMLMIQNDVWAVSLSNPSSVTLIIPDLPSGDAPSGAGIKGAMDPAHDRVLVVEPGIQYGFPPAVWELRLNQGPSWRKLRSTGAISGLFGRTDFSLVYDSVQDRLIYFGGRSCFFEYCDPASNLVGVISCRGDSAQWTQLSPLGSPPLGRYGHEAVYDPVRQRMIVVDGIVGSGNVYTNELNVLDLAGTPTWSRPSTPVTPLTRIGERLLYDPIRDRVLLFGGNNGSQYYGDTWELPLDGSWTWHPIAPSGPTPSARSRVQVVHDRVRDRLLLYGGDVAYNAPINDAWTLALSDGSGWSSYAAVFPPARQDHAAAFDADAGAMIIQGGSAGSGDTWAFTSPSTWTRLTATGPNLVGHSMIVDPVRRRALVFGGYDAVFGFTNEVRALDLDSPSAWSVLSVAGTPPAVRASHGAVYDPVRDRMLVFGGKDLSGYFHDLWELSLAGTPTWSPISPGGAIPGNYEYECVYDPVRDRLLAVGGLSDQSYYHGEVRALPLTGGSGWQLLQSGTIPFTPNMTVVYDPGRDRLVAIPKSFEAATYAYEMPLSGAPAWRTLASSGLPPAGSTSGAPAIFDPALDRLVFFSGQTWVLDFRGELGVPPVAQAARLRLAASYPNPTSGGSRLRFTLPRAAKVALRLYDLAGRECRTLVDEALPAGHHDARWDGNDRDGRRAAPGIYMVSLTAGEERVSRRLVVAR